MLIKMWRTSEQLWDFAASATEMSKLFITIAWVYTWGYGLKA